MDERQRSSGKVPMPMGVGHFVIETSTEYVDSRGGRVVKEAKAERVVGEMYLDRNGLPVQNLTIQRSANKQAFDPTQPPRLRIGGSNLSNANRQLEYGKTNSSVQITELEERDLSRSMQQAEISRHQGVTKNTYMSRAQDSKSGFQQHSHSKDTDIASRSGFDTHSCNKDTHVASRSGFETHSRNKDTHTSPGSGSRNKASEEPWSRTQFYSSSSQTSILLEYSSEEIQRATNGLSESFKIGEGGYGNVYKGFLRNTKVAIKILDPNSKQGQSEFDKELENLGGLRHPNLVTLRGASFEDRALVYEFLSNGSLEDFLRSKDRSRKLTWQIRTRIVYGVCVALGVLHSRSIIHGDLKPSNILLDDDFNSKLGDFGLSRFLPEGSTHHKTRVFGTPGYIDPVFMQTGKVSASSDLYSFGVTILRLVTGIEAPGIGMKVHSSYTDNSLKRMIDPTAGDWPFKMAQQLTYLGLKCCHDNEKNLELMKEIRTGLEGMLDKI